MKWLLVLVHARHILDNILGGGHRRGFRLALVGRSSEPARRVRATDPRGIAEMLLAVLGRAEGFHGGRGRVYCAAGRVHRAGGLRFFFAGALDNLSFTISV